MPNNDGYVRTADDDKPHRCPTCWRIPDRIYDRHHHARWWAIYRCQNGHRFSRLPRLLRWLTSHNEDEGT